MRFGVKVGPFYASTSTRRRRGNNSVVGWVFALALIAGVLFWPVFPAENAHGDVPWWGWLLLIPWWLTLFIGYGVYLNVKDRKPGKAKSAPVGKP